MISRPKDRERPKRREHSPPDPVFNAVADLFDWAANGVADPEAPHLLKYSDSKGKASPDALRFAVGLSGRWNFWPNASWQGGDVPMRQYYYNRVLIELFSGEPKSHPFDNGEANKNAILIFEYLRKDYPEELNSAVQFLKQYSADLLKNNKSAGKADRSSGKPTIAVEQTRSLPSRETAAFIGVQKDTSHEQTAAINRCFKDVLVNADASDVPSSLSSLSFQLKHRTKGPALRDQKSVLYGRIPDAKLTLGPADFVDLKLTFNRTLSDKLFSYIGKLSDPFSSYTILARPGQGKSIALAQVLLNLLSTPGCWTFWSFDTNVAFECENGVKCIEKYIDLFRQSKCIPRRLIFIFDDIDRRSDYDAIHAFHSYCEQYSIANQMAISFLLSLTDYNLSITDNVFQLSLDTDDENRLYEVLLTEEPRMAGKAFDSIEDLLSVHPVVFAWKNDVQSATDFIIQHSTPLRDFTPEWFSDLKREGELTKRALEIIAVSTLLDLELPEHIAHGMCEIDSGTLLERPIVLTSYSRRIGYEKTAGHSQSDRWPGYVLTSPYYASSLLRRLEKLDEDFVKDTIVEMVGRSLARAEQQINLWKRTDAEFLRHLFQRLGKRKVNRLAGFSDGTKIAGELFERYGPSILQTLQRDKSSVTFANWAGTFSYILVPRKVRQFNTESKTTEQMVYELCSFALKESPIVDDPQVFVTLLLAIRAVCEPYSGDPGVKDLADAARITLDLNRVLDSIESIGDSEAERRSNQAVLSYAKFLRIIPDWSMYERCHEVTRVYDRVAKRFQASNFRFDALNSVERANVVWIRTGDGVAISQRAQYLREARNVAGQRHQVRHKSEVERAIAKFQKDYGRDIDDLA